MNYNPKEPNFVCFVCFVGKKSYLAPHVNQHLFLFCCITIYGIYFTKDNMKNDAIAVHRTQCFIQYASAAGTFYIHTP